MTDRRLSDETLGEALLAPGRGDRAPRACPDEGLYWDLARGALDPAALDRALDHARDCSSCWLALRVARETFAASGLAIEPVRARGAGDAADAGRAANAATGGPSLVARALHALLRPAPAFALLALLALGYPVYRALSRGGPGSVPPAGVAEYRAPAAGEPRSLVADGATLPRDAFVLRWTSAGPDATYAVAVTTPDLVEVFAARGVRTTEFRVPPEAIAAFPAGTRLVWRLDAQLSDGARRSSPAQFVVLADRSP